MNGSKDKDDVGIETDPEKKSRSFFKMKQKYPYLVKGVIFF